MSHHYRFLLLLAPFVVSCASTRIPGEYARVSIAPSFSMSNVRTVAMLPMTLEGKENQRVDRLTGDRLAARLLDLGFRVIDQTRIEAEATQRKIDLTKPLTDRELRELASALNVDAYVTGSIAWRYIPAHSESNPDIIQTTHTEIKSVKGKDGKSRNDTLIVREDVPTIRQSSTEGQFVATGESIKLISASNGEVLIGGSAPNGSYDMTDEIVDAIRYRLFPPPSTK
jgi:hypothetical protein